MKEEIKNLKTSVVYRRFQAILKQCYLILLSVDKIQKVKSQGLKRQKMEE